ncbi:MAG: response regulator transcription factor [Mobilicoccus sp.]|nr:response regulator transcription factor [Mobilicoccus sp.]
MTTVLIADDQEMVRVGFRMILAAEDGIEVVGEAADGPSAIEAIRRLRPDVALLDIRMPHLDGLEVTAQVSEETAVVVVTTFGDEHSVDTALENGAVGFIVKDSGPALLVSAVRAAAQGDALISPELTLPLLRRRAAATPGGAEELEVLSERELDVARLVARGRTNAEIASELFLALSTVKSHLSHIQQRLNLRNRVEVAAMMWRHGAVS